MDDSEHDEYVSIPIDGILDLHMFSAKDVKTLVPDYIEECRARDILEIRFIHGKGIGNLRRSVHALLARNRAVKSFRLAGNDAGGWGATIALLHAKE